MKWIIWVGKLFYNMQRKGHDNHHGEDTTFGILPLQEPPLSKSKTHHYLLFVCLKNRPFREGELTQEGPWSDFRSFLVQSRCRRKTRVPGKTNLWKQFWTRNQKHVSAVTGNQTRDSLVQSEGRYPALTCFYFVLMYEDIWNEVWYCMIWYGYIECVSTFL